MSSYERWAFVTSLGAMILYWYSLMIHEKLVLFIFIDILLDDYVFLGYLVDIQMNRNDERYSLRSTVTHFTDGNRSPECSATWQLWGSHSALWAPVPPSVEWIGLRGLWSLSALSSNSCHIYGTYSLWIVIWLIPLTTKDYLECVDYCIWQDTKLVCNWLWLRELPG